MKMVTGSCHSLIIEFPLRLGRDTVKPPLVSLNSEEATPGFLPSFIPVGSRFKTVRLSEAKWWELVLSFHHIGLGDLSSTHQGWQQTL